MAVLARRPLQGAEGAHMGRARWLLTDSPGCGANFHSIYKHQPLDVTSSGASMLRAK